MAYSFAGRNFCGTKMCAGSSPCGRPPGCGRHRPDMAIGLDQLLEIGRRQIEAGLAGETDDFVLRWRVGHAVWTCKGDARVQEAVPHVDNHTGSDPFRPTACRPAAAGGAIRRPCLRPAPPRDLCRRPDLVGRAVVPLSRRAADQPRRPGHGASIPTRPTTAMPAWTTASPTACSMSIRRAVSAALGGARPPFVPDVVADDPVLAGLLREAFADFPQRAGAAGRRCRRRAAGRAAGRSAAMTGFRRGRGAHGPSRRRTRPRLPRRRSAAHRGLGGTGEA